MSALFYDYNVQVPAKHRQVCCVWGESAPVLAAGLDNREIHFFSDEGEKAPGSVMYSRGADIVTAAWRPRGGALAVGWSDGMISLWAYKESVAREVNSPHSGRITLVKWAPTGNRLITADETGCLAVWKVDARSQLSLATTYVKQGAITQCVFMPVKTAKPELFPTCPPFIFGGEIGSIHRANDVGQVADIQVLNHAIDAMMYYEEKNQLVVITRSLQLFVFEVDAAGGKAKQTHKAKLSFAGDGGLRETKWAAPGLLAMASGEPLIRFWDLQLEEASVLTLPKSVAGASQPLRAETASKGNVTVTTNALSVSNYQVNSVDFAPRRRIFAAGTAQGVVFFWRYSPVVSVSIGDDASSKKETTTTSHRWDLIFTVDIQQSIQRIEWSTVYGTLYANTTEGAFIFHEGSTQRMLVGDTAVIQHAASKLSIEKFRDNTLTQSTLEAAVRIKGLSTDGASVVVWNGSKAEVYELRENDIKRISQFNCSSSMMVIRGESIYRANENHIEVCNMQGVVKNSVSFTEVEGKPALLSVLNKFLAVSTDRGYLRVFDLSRRDPKSCGSMGNFFEFIREEVKSAAIRAIAVNSDGTRIGIVAERLEGALKIPVPLPKLYVFQTDLNTFHQFDFGSERHPISVYFDPIEPRLLACETNRVAQDAISAAAPAGATKNADATDGGNGNAGGSRPASSSKEVTTMFVSNDHGILMQDSFELDAKFSALLGIHVPRVYLIAQMDRSGGDFGSSDAAASYLRTRIMRDFVGLEKLNDATRQALIDFSYFATIGNMDEAYRTVKQVETPSVWENMAKMCVKTKRLDVAEVCLGNMGHARGSAAVHEAKQQPEPEVPVAMVAIQLGLRDEAARLYRECNRYDLLNKLYQATGFWNKAVDTAAKKDRIHLKNTNYMLAQHLEEIGDIKEAMEAYEDAGMHQREIPRMLFKLGRTDLLQKYVATSKDRELLIWWGQFEESQGQFDAAIESYERAKDDLSVVRVLCFKKDMEGAARVVEAGKNRAAAYHLARQFEARDDPVNAIHYYAMGNCYNHAIRLAKEHNMDSELTSFALMSKPSDMLECAAYFESKREMEKAVQLYHKGGNIEKALDLCFQAQLFEELHELTDDLGPTNTSPALLKKCAGFFIENGHYAKAVHLCLVVGQGSEALDICIQHDVKITEEMAEKMTPPKDDPSDGKDAQKKRIEILRKLAKCLKRQGSYHLATKKYTQAGEKIKAMKCLLKSGDTEKIVFFANVSRHNDIYVLAANYLQTLDWRKDPEILKNIVGFYSKARAMEQLAGFYQACAQTEIDEFHDYTKAIGALQEAIKVLSRVQSAKKEALIKGVETSIFLMEQFVQAREQVRQSPGAIVSALLKLLEEQDVDRAIRIGDIYALIMEAHCIEGEWEKAGEALRVMKQKGLAIKSYVNARMLDEVQRKLGVTDEASDRSRRSSRVEQKSSPREDEPAAARRGNVDRMVVSEGRDDDEGEMEEDIADETE